MEIETSRLRLRCWRPEDRAPFAAINDETAVRRFLLPLTHQASDAMLERIEAHFGQYGWGFWALEERTTGSLIGLCGLAHVAFSAFFTPAVEIGWRLSTPYHGKGFAREAAEAVLAFAFNEAGLDRVVAFTVPANTASWGLMRRLGIHEIGEFGYRCLALDHPLHRHVVYEIRRPTPSWVDSGYVK
jgi:RimJ/RimL family protein N-acetyltransferase